MKNGFGEVTLPIVAVDLMSKMNELKRTDVKFDKHFMKALVIAVCTIKGLKESLEESRWPFKEGEVDFMKGKQFI